MLPKFWKLCTLNDLFINTPQFRHVTSLEAKAAGLHNVNIAFS